MRSSILETLLNNERRILQQLRVEKAEIGEGRLHIIRENERLFFREYCNHRQRGITKDKRRVYQLARKDILNEQLHACERTVRELERICSLVSELNLSGCEDKYIKKYDMLDSNKLLYSTNELEWIERRASQNPYKRENLIYETSDGIMMRSKSERYIGDFIGAYNLVYMYEPKIQIEGRIVYPDFMILRPDGKSVIWEHLGMTDNIDYFNKSMLKIQEYRKIGYMPNLNLICTYEEDLHNVERLKEIVDRYIYL